MHKTLDDVFNIVNRVFDILDLVVVRLTLLGLAALGAYAVLTK